MKKLIIIAISLLPAAAMAQTAFTLKGSVGHLNSPNKAIFSYSDEGSGHLDSTSVVDGKFSFSGSLNGNIAQARVQIVHEVPADVRTGKFADIYSFYLEPKAVIELYSATDSVRTAVIKNSAVNDDANIYAAFTWPVTQASRALTKEYILKTPEEKKDEGYMKTVHTRDEATGKKLVELNTKFIAAHPNSYVSLGAFSYNIGTDPGPTAEAEFNKFPAELQSTTLGKTIAAKIEAAKKTAVGQLSMDFTENDVNDKPVKLSDFKGKYVLLDFWASWCRPCRAENPNIVKAYNAYKDKNFTILSVSLDAQGQKAAWVKAIENDGLVWNNVSDLKYWGNAAVREYGIKSIPANFLIDPNGKIVARNIRGEELQTKLAEIIGGAKTNP